MLPVSSLITTEKQSMICVPGNAPEIKFMIKEYDLPIEIKNGTVIEENIYPYEERKKTFYAISNEMDKDLQIPPNMSENGKKTEIMKLAHVFISNYEPNSLVEFCKSIVTDKNATEEYFKYMDYVNELIRQQDENGTDGE